MRKTLYLHIGHFKTGTTALQWFLTENARYLRKNGLQYDQSLLNFNKHSRLAFSIYRAVGIKTLMHGYSLTVTPREVWTTLFDAVRASKVPTTIVSTEEFMRMGAYPDAAAMLGEMLALGADIDIRAIVYLRSPNDHLKSWYNQLVKMGIPVPGFDETVCTRMEPIHYDYARALAPWIAHLGADKVVVRPYVRGGEQGTALIADFIETVGGAWNGVTKVKLPDEDPNPGLDPALLAFRQRMLGADQPEAAIDWTMRRVEGYLASDAGAAARVDEAAFQQIVAASRSGLEAIGDMLDPSVVALYKCDPPTPGPEISANEDLALRLSGFLLTEVQDLRKRLKNTTWRLEKRLDELEARLGKGR